MNHIYIIAGMVLVILTLLDTFFTVLNYNQRGLMFNRLMGVEWEFLHWLFRPLKREVRNHIYKVMTGVTLLSGILLWVGEIILGFALVYYGLANHGLLKFDAGTPDGFIGAIYFSIGQFSTVGAEGVRPGTSFGNILSVSEALVSVMLLSLVITYLVNIFASIQDLRTYCACFPSASSEVDSPLLTLAPYLALNDTPGVGSHLSGVRDAMNAYFDSIAADHSALYFNSGRARLTMPFAIFYTAETIEALTYGLGEDHEVSKLPRLIRLTLSFETNRRQLYELLRWAEPKGAAPLPLDAFVAEARRSARIPMDEPVADPGLLPAKPIPVRAVKNLEVRKQVRDFRTEKFQSSTNYVKRFVRLRQVTARMAGLDEPQDWKQEYSAYVTWLSKVPASDDFIRRTSLLFDYRPVVEVGPDSSGAPLGLYGWQSKPET